MSNQTKAITLISLLCLLFLCTHAQVPQKVRLTDIPSLTFYEGYMTTARRSAPVQTLNCIGGSARREYQSYPKIVECMNVGYDGYDVQWECHAELDNTVKFGRVQVSCEGFDFPEDPYVLMGSCGLEYELEYTPAGRNVRARSGDGDSDGFAGLVILVIIVVIFVIVACKGKREPVHVYPTPSAPYQDDYQTQNAYMAGVATGRNMANHYDNQNNYNDNVQPNSGTRDATGYGGTKRR
eukprot:TRINITY_DN9716_c0_g1_i1.p1 TRINITY_DN9716_c0_g1~~TRINITY_DN9716_c0_g1_i1.p1  ORF type:complete len:249 (+),score=48.20 TRINITY_DN9716_c0_g1_i1:35-748(+)